MKRKILMAMATMALLLLNTTKGAAQGMSVNTTGSRPDTSAILDVSATTKGMLMPRMTMAQRNAIVLPATGLLVFQTDGTAGYYYNAGTSASPIWTGISSSGLAPGTSTGQMMYWSGSAWLNLGIGSNGQVLTVNSGVPIWATTSSYIATTPILTANLLTNISSTGVTSGGNISSSGGASVTARGVCWSPVSGPTTALLTKTIDGIGIGSFMSSITGLTMGFTYYGRAYATNSSGTAYSNELSFTTASPPILTTTSITGISSKGASSGGNISSEC